MRYLILTLLIATTFMGCKKDDPCEDVTCLNGGECVDGTCDCPTGYSGPTCADYDACINVTCQNNGVCVNGTCVCPTGYTGANCSSEATPSSMRITKIVVTNFFNSGWDTFPASSPDIYINVGTGTSCSTGLYASGRYQDAYPGPNYDFVPNNPLVISNPTSPISICLYDYDVSGDDFMAGVNFNPYQSGADFPAMRTVSVSGLTCDVYFTYYW
jgi:hypothetical protein